MAKAATETANEGKSGSKMGLILAVVGAALFAAAAAAGAMFFLMPKPADPSAETADATEADAEPAKPKGPAQYVEMSPAFVVNLENDSAHFLQVGVTLMTRDPSGEEVVETHTPLIRNALMLLFSQQTMNDVASRAGKEVLQQKALEETQRVLSDEIGKPLVESLYFTTFVTQ